MVSNELPVCEITIELTQKQLERISRASKVLQMNTDDFILEASTLKANEVIEMDDWTTKECSKAMNLNDN